MDVYFLANKQHTQFLWLSAKRLTLPIDLKHRTKCYFRRVPLKYTAQCPPTPSNQHLHASYLQRASVMLYLSPQDLFILHIKPEISNIFLVCFIFRSIFLHKYWSNRTIFSLFHRIKVCCTPCPCCYRMERPLCISWQETIITLILHKLNFL